MMGPGFPLNNSINLSSAYYFKNINDLKNYYKNKFSSLRYTRDANSGSIELERYFEKIYRNSSSLSFSSGMSAIAGSLIGTINKKTTIVTFGNFYRKSRSIIDHLNKKFGIKILNFLDYKKFITWSKKKPKNIVFFLEIPSNPFMKIIDLHDIRSRFKSSTIITDLSFVGIKNDRNIYNYSDILIFSLTKYINGHNDTLGGQVVIKNQKFFQKIWDYRSTFGGIIDPFAAYLTLRSLKTYALRFSKMTENTEKILEYLSSFDEVKNIWYPGEYKNKNQDARFKKYFLNGGAVISFETKKIDSIRNFGKLKHFKMAPSFGSLESLIEWPYYMSYFGQPKKILKKLNITKNLIRMSIGIENIEFLQKDIKKLLKK